MKLHAVTLSIVAGLLLSVAVPAADPSAPAPAAPAAAPASVPLVTQEALLTRQKARDPELFLLDVRTPEEFAAGHVPGAVNIPHDQVESRLAEIPHDKDVVLYCHSGRRAGIAASALAAHGYKRLAHLEGDMIAWQGNGRPLETAPAKP